MGRNVDNELGRNVEANRKCFGIGQRRSEKKKSDGTREKQRMKESREVKRVVKAVQTKLTA